MIDDDAVGVPRGDRMVIGENLDAMDEPQLRAYIRGAEAALARGGQTEPQAAAIGLGLARARALLERMTILRPSTSAASK